MSTLWRFVLRQPRRRPFRAFLTLAGIVIGVASIVAVSLTTQATRQVYQRMFQLVAGKAQLEVVREGRTPFTPDLISVTKSVSGVQSAIGSVQHSVIVMSSFTDQKPFFALGIDPTSDGEVRNYEFVAGRMIEKADETMLAASMAKRLKLGIDDSITVVAKSGISRKKIVGLLKSVGPARVNQGAVVFLHITAARRMFGLKDQINAISVAVKDGERVAQVQARIQEKLPSGLLAQEPQMRGQLVRHTMMNLEQLLSVLSIVFERSAWTSGSWPKSSCAKESRSG